jgi:peptide/nickel transport system ATP-binding protein
VADIADRVMVMQNGNIVESGTTNEVLKSPSHSYTKELSASSLARIKKEKITQEIKKPISKTPLLEVVDICVNYASVIKKHKEVINAVDHVSFNIYENEIVGLVGESGCGKTTLGRTILQLIKPSSGQIKLKGKDITGIASSAIKKLRQDFQIVFQDPYGSLNPRLSIGNAIMEVLKAHQLHDNDNKRREKVIELLEKVQLPADFFSRYPHQFSGGQRQRICFARALATAPSFIVFDEALSALDLNIQSSMLSLINNLKLEFGFSALFISHDLGLVKQICDRIMVMQKGAIIESGSTESIFNQPSHDYTKQLLEAIPGKRLFI